MLLVFDENFSKRLAEGLDLLEKANPGRAVHVDVIAAEKLMGKRDASDADIIKAMGKHGIFITKDKDVKYFKLLKNVIVQNDAKVLFFMSSKKLIYFWDTLTAIINRWDNIKEVLNRPMPPHLYEFNIRTGIKECHF